MNVLVDTSVWSLALRHSKTAQPPKHTTKELRMLIDEARACIAGCIRQEVLSGIAKVEKFAALRDRLRAFPDLPATTDTYELAAQLFNQCRGRGVQGSHTDFLICALAKQHGISVFSTDNDFLRYSQLCDVRLYTPRFKIAGDNP